MPHWFPDEPRIWSLGATLDQTTDLVQQRSQANPQQCAQIKSGAEPQSHFLLQVCLLFFTGIGHFSSTVIFYVSTLNLCCANFGAEITRKHRKNCNSGARQSLSTSPRLLQFVDWLKTLSTTVNINKSKRKWWITMSSKRSAWQCRRSARTAIFV